MTHWVSISVVLWATLKSHWSTILYIKHQNVSDWLLCSGSMRDCYFLNIVFIFYYIFLKHPPHWNQWICSIFWLSYLQCVGTLMLHTHPCHTRWLQQHLFVLNERVSVWLTHKQSREKVESEVKNGAALKLDHNHFKSWNFPTSDHWNKQSVY